MKLIKETIRAGLAAAIFALLASQAQAAQPVANAGPDISLANYDGDNSVTVKLNGSASTDADGNIVSYAWSWPGGSANGVSPEATFPVTNGIITVVLTVTDATGGVSTDSLLLGAYGKEQALFTEFKKPAYRDVGGGLEGASRGNLLVVDFAGVEIYRRSGQMWAQENFPVSSGNHFPVDQNTVVTLDLVRGDSRPSITRFANSTWTDSDVTFSPADTILDGFNNQRVFAIDPQTVVIADPGSDLSVANGGSVRVYEWSGNTWTFQADLAPPGGLVASGAFGKQVEVQGDCIVVAGYNPVSFSNEFHVFRKISGAWTHEITFDGKRSLADPAGVFQEGFGFGNNVLVSSRTLAGGSSYELVIYEKTGSVWNQRILNTGAGLIRYSRYDVDSDGDAFAISADAFGRQDYLVRRQGADWQSGAILPELIATGGVPDLRISQFSDNLLTLRDGAAGVLRVVDTQTSIFPINIEPVANAGSDVRSTSFDGQPLSLFLNGAASFDPDMDLPLQAVWTWAGGSATGLTTFASIPPSVTSIELKITDARGAISKDSIAVDIDQPPVIQAGLDRVVVDANGDGSIRLNVGAQVTSQDNPIVSYLWTWPGGSFSGASGTITLGQIADSKNVTLTVTDQAGLASTSRFRFNLLNPNPVPTIISPTDAANTDRFGHSVSINGASALVGALSKSATYQIENINGNWQEIAPLPAGQQGSAVAVASDYSFSGGDLGSGQVRVMVKTNNFWSLSQTLVPPPAGVTGINPGKFGRTLARSGDVLVVGAPGSWAVGGSFFEPTGAAYVYRLTGGSWLLEQTLVPPTTQLIREFGNAVAIHGQRIAISSHNGTTERVVVFERGSTWDQVAILEIPAPNNGFRNVLAMNDTEILVGASEQGPSQRGLVYRYKKTAGVWQPNGEILPVLATTPAGGFFSGFGTSMWLKDNTLVVGVAGDYLGNINRGSVQTFILRNGNWDFVGSLAMTAQIDPTIGQSLIGFADSSGFVGGSSSVSHDGRNLIVGATQALSSSGVQSGKAYIYSNYAALDPTANHEPLANAGADINGSDTIVRGPAPTYLITEPLGSQLVTLDGSASTDRENAIASYEWAWPGGSASGVSPSARFPVGTTMITLTVTDALGVVNSDTLSVTVSLTQTAPAVLPAFSGNTLTLGLPSPTAKWRLSSEFLWHGDNESTTGVEVGATYQVEVLPYPGSTEVVSTFITINSPAMSLDLELDLLAPPSSTASLSFPETSQGFSWRLVGESAWRNVADDGDPLVENVEHPVPTGLLRIEFKPVAGFTTPQNRLLNGIGNTLTSLDWAEYLRINSYNPAKTFELAASPNLASSPYRYVGLIRSALGRGTGTVVADRVVLTAAHLFFDSNGLQWADTQWHSRQQQGTRQAPPIAPRGVLYQTSYAKLIAPDSVEGTVADLPEDPQQVDFAVLFFADQATWDQGSANFLQSTPAKNWLTGAESKHAVAYPQRSQEYENRGKIFQKQFATPLQSLGTGLYETTEVFGDGGASGSALFVQPAGGTNFYPAAILLAGQGRAVYRVIDEGITRMIKDGEDAATGNDDVLNNDSSLVVFNGLGSLTTIGVQVAPDWLAGHVRWSIYPANAAGVTNMPVSQRVAFNTRWTGYTIYFSAVSGYNTPPPFYQANGSVVRGAANIRSVTYSQIIPPPPPPTPLENWVAQYSVTDFAADDDQDGMSALLEYALDRNPSQADYRSAILVSDSPSQNLYPEYDVYVSSTAAGITYQVKASNSPDRSNPSTLATFTHVDGPSTYRKVTDTQQRSASQTRFAWVEIIKP